VEMKKSFLNQEKPEAEIALKPGQMPPYTWRSGLRNADSAIVVPPLTPKPTTTSSPSAPVSASQTHLPPGAEVGVERLPRHHLRRRRAAPMEALS
jgi:hypothetical protein